MGWIIEYTDEFGSWWSGLGEREQEELAAVIELLGEGGPRLGFPYTSGVALSRHSHMRELRMQVGGRPFRVFYAFDPRRTVILLIGGGKTGDKRFYQRYVPVADRLYDEHLEELKQEGAIK